MTGTEPGSLGKLIEKALTLSCKADEDPSAAQALTDLLKTLQAYDVRSYFASAGGKGSMSDQAVQDIAGLKRHLAKACILEHCNIRQDRPLVPKGGDCHTPN